jgi:hypothetical protein
MLRERFAAALNRDVRNFYLGCRHTHRGAMDF